MQQLLDASILARELPFGESLRSTKKTLYRIADPAMRCQLEDKWAHCSLRVHHRNVRFEVLDAGLLGG